MSNNVRVVIIEAQGPDAAIGQALAGFLRALDRAPVAAETPAPQITPAPPVLTEPRALPPGAPAQRHKVASSAGPVTRRAARVASAPAKANGAADAGTRANIIAALEKRPMTSGEVITATGWASRRCIPCSIFCAMKAW